MTDVTSVHSLLQTTHDLPFQILVAEGDASLLNATELFLSREGYQVTIAADGLQVMKLCQEQTPDLLLVGSNLPLMDGFQLCQRLKRNAQWQDRPILLTIFQEDDDIIQRLYDVGADDYLAKPIQWVVLSHRIHRLLSHRHACRVIQKGLSESLSQSEMKYRSLFNAMLNGFALHQMILDEEGSACDFRYLDVNRAYEIMIGLAAHQVIGRRGKELFPNLDSEWLNRCAKVALGGSPVRFHYYCKDVNKHFEVFAFSSQRGQVATVLLDITARKNSEDALLLAKKKAEEGNKEKNEFLMRLSHEIRAPLNVILGMSDLLTESALQEKQQHYVATVRTAGESVLEVISHILDMSLESTQQPPCQISTSKETENAQSVCSTSSVSSVPRILLVEDSPDNRTLVHAYLKNHSYLLEDAENGAVALEKLAEGSIDLVLMDIQMPVMDGYHATRQWRSWERERGLARVPIIALTAHALPEDVCRCLEAGCDIHLAKPVRKQVLLDTLQKCFGEMNSGKK
ncbi:MAG: response regulator [Magnetococcales bacterium]|nr:response regulator [Magnetococcales bacterium]NGZ25864.1 response regulator [Magnetococcales bacterium]